MATDICFPAPFFFLFCSQTQSFKKNKAYMFTNYLRIPSLAHKDPLLIWQCASEQSWLTPSAPGTEPLLSSALPALCKYKT